MRGFTLIETLIYLGLFSLIMAAACEAMFAITESSTHDAARAYLLEQRLTATSTEISNEP